ncbi:MAG TPA: hypothetical protein VKI41_18295 [Vicinamibacteria bacterium]|nr:hypothetical protein [Vicinamibacteria bacterium]
MRYGASRDLLIPFAGLVLCGGWVATVQAMRSDLTQFLQNRIAFQPAQLAAAEGGHGVVKVLDAPNKREVALFGLVRVEVPKTFWVKQLVDFPASLRVPGRTRLGIFSDPPAAADVAEFAVSHADVQELKHCKPRDCQVKLPASLITRVRREIDLSAPGAEDQLSRIARQGMLDYVASYRTLGNAAMVVYNDTGEVSSSEAFASLLAESPYVYDYVPAFHEYLKQCPGAKPPGITEILFWSTDQMQGLKPIVSITHLVVYTPPETPELTVVGAKQIYADHYFEGGLEVMILVDDKGAKPAKTYLLLLRRYLFDDLPSGGLLNIRGKVVGKLRDQMAADLQRQKTGREEDFAKAGHGT